MGAFKRCARSIEVAVIHVPGDSTHRKGVERSVIQVTVWYPKNSDSIDQHVAMQNFLAAVKGLKDLMLADD